MNFHISNRIINLAANMNHYLQNKTFSSPKRMYLNIKERDSF